MTIRYFLTLLVFCILLWGCAREEIHVKTLLEVSPHSDQGKWLLKLDDYKIYEKDFINEYILPL